MINFKINLKNYKYGKQNYNFNIKKLNSNENPFPPSIKLIKNLIKEIKYFGNFLRFYPDPYSKNLKIIISKFYNFKIENVFLGNGSDEIIGFIFFFLYKNKNYLKLNNLTYIFYESYIKLFNIKYKIIKTKNLFLNKNYKKNYSNIILTNPNVPSSQITNFYIVEKIIINNINSIILIDETYIDYFFFGCQNFIKFYKNIIIIRTLSKSRSVAGLRLGFCFSDKKFIKILENIKNSFNIYPINILNQIIIKNSFKDVYYFQKINTIINKNKNKLIEFLIKKNFKVLKSNSNYILIKNKNLNANNLSRFLYKNNFYIRKFEIPKLENYIRLTLGLKRDCVKLINKLNNYLKLNK